MKKESFGEEVEWRMFFTNPTYKNPDWILNKTTEELKGPERFSQTIKFLQDRIGFRPTIDDLIPYCKIEFKEFKESPINSIWIGPKNNIRISDINLFLKKYGYHSANVVPSRITYC